MSGWHGRDGQRSIYGLTICQVVLFSVCLFPREWHNLWACLVYLLVVEFTFPLLHKDTRAELCQHFMFSWTLAEVAAIIRRVWVKKWSGRTFLLPEQMLHYTTLVYLRPLRSVHQTWPWRLSRRRRFNKRLATRRRHCKRYKTVCVNL